MQSKSTMDGQEFSDRVLMAQNKNKLAWAEGEITKGVNQIGRMLKEIHDKAYWKNGEYDSFEDYCRKRWDMGKSRSYELLKAENTKLMLSDITKGDLNNSGLPETLKVSELIELSKVEPEKAAQIMVEVAKEGKPTAKKIKAKVSPKKENPILHPAVESNVGHFTICPSCGHSF